MSGRYVLDTGALLAIEREPTGAIARRCRYDARSRRPPLLPTTVFAQAWRGSPRQHALVEVRRNCETLLTHLADALGYRLRVVTV